MCGVDDYTGSYAFRRFGSVREASCPELGIVLLVIRFTCRDSYLELLVYTEFRGCFITLKFTLVTLG